MNTAEQEAALDAMFFYAKATRTTYVNECVNSDGETYETRCLGLYQQQAQARHTWAKMNRVMYPDHRMYQNQCDIGHRGRYGG